MNQSRFTEEDLAPKREATLDQTVIAAQKLGYIDAILDLQRLLKDDLQLDGPLRREISRSMMALKDKYLLPQNSNAYDKL